MKKLFYYQIIVTIIMLSTIYFLPNNSLAEIRSNIKGDVNNDFRVTGTDARLILRKAAGLNIQGTFIDYNADFDENKKINATDAKLVLRIASGEMHMLVDALTKRGKSGSQLGFNNVPWCALFVTKYYNRYYPKALKGTGGLDLAFCDDLVTIGIYKQCYHHVSEKDFIGINKNYTQYKNRIKIDKNYTPKQGDLIFFDYEKNGYANHVGFVTGVCNGYIKTLEGNSGGIVAENKYKANSSTIMGYFSLKEATQ